MDIIQQIHEITIAYMNATNAHKLATQVKSPEDYTKTYIKIHKSVGSVFEEELNRQK